MKIPILLRVSLILSSLCFQIARGDESFNPPPLSQLIPEDKHLDPAWVKSLAERGEPHVCSGNELKHIGMPIGGLFAGQIYIGGDGQLWLWDVFNDFRFTGWSGNYAPLPVSKPLEQSFSLVIDGRETPLDATAFSNLTFRGEYPMAFVTYQDPKVPVEVHLTAYSPFIPLNTDDSSLPLTVLEYTVKNTAGHPVSVALKGTLENFVLDRERGALNGTRVNTLSTTGNLTLLEETVEPEAAGPTTQDRVLEDWSKPDFTGWKVEGTAFGNAPFEARSLTPEQQKKGFAKLGEGGDGFVSSSLIPARTAGQNPAGKLTSAPFTIDRRHLYFWMRPEDRNHNSSGLDLLVDGKAVVSVHPAPASKDVPQLHLQTIDLGPYIGKQGVLQIVDNEKGNAGGITVGKIFLSDREMLYNSKLGKIEAFQDAEDNGSMGLALLDGPTDLPSGNQRVPAPQRLVGMLGRTVNLQPGESRTLTFLVGWYFPNLYHIPHVAEQVRWYASKFNSVGDVFRYFVQNRGRLAGDTKKWHDTWYDSTLPYWFLDRTMIPTDNLASSTNYRFKNGRWWAFEGIGSCDGTCGHVYGYAQAIARLFPDVERDQRERIDLGTSLKPDGVIDCRGECKGGPAIDAQGFYILRALREHQMTTDNTFLTRIWPGVKKAMDYMISQDPGEKGLIEGAQHNTLDADWYGEVSWYNGIYLAALRASAQMADVMGDPNYAARCRKIADAGEAYMKANLFNGEYFQNKVDPAHLNTINSGSGCEIDQVLGQSWAFQVGLPRILPKKETVSSLDSLWKYNFAPDVGPYRAAYKKGRVYAVAGEAGLIMCTFPRPDWDLGKASGQGSAMFASYFNECMTGFEHQVAGHMMWEGAPDSDLTERGLAIERAINDRYAPAKRNPYNEVECGDHYGRAMAAYGVYLAACGFEYDGPKRAIGFAPRIHPEDFKATFTSAEGWGSYAQKIIAGSMVSTLNVKWGKLRLKSISLAPTFAPTTVSVMLGAKEVPASLARQGDQTVITLSPDVTLTVGQSLELTLK